MCDAVNCVNDDSHTYSEYPCGHQFFFPLSDSDIIKILEHMQSKRIIEFRKCKKRFSLSSTKIVFISHFSY